MSSLEIEARAFESNLTDMLRGHAGEYVVIKGPALRHFARNYEEAVTWAYETFGLERFFIRKIAEEADAVHFTRDLPCRR